MLTLDVRSEVRVSASGKPAIVLRKLVRSDRDRSVDPGRTEAARHVIGPSASIAIDGSKSGPLSACQTRARRSEPPV